MTINSRQKGTEEWRAVEGYEGIYEVSNMGRLRSLDRTIDHERLKKARRKGVVIKQYKNKRNGYMYATLAKENTKRSVRVHRLIAIAFIPNPNNYDQVNHINGDKTDNRVENLEWCTQSYNMLHAFREGLQPVTWNKEVIRLDDGKIFNSTTEAAIESGGKSTAIIRVCKGQRSHYKGKEYAYYEDYLNNAIPPFQGNYRRGYDKWQ